MTIAMLAPHHLKMLRDDSGIPEAIIQARGYFTATTKTALTTLGFSPVQCRVPALVLPIHNVYGEVGLYQIRPDTPRHQKPSGRPCKYEMPTGVSMVLDVPPEVRQFLGDPTISLFVTEGVKKGDALAARGCCTVTLLGVWNWRGTNGHGGRTALPDWEVIALHSRQVYIVFDSDVMTKREVHAALARLKAFLESRGATVALVYLPPGPGGTKQGVDDFLVLGHSVRDLLALASPEVRRFATDHGQTHPPDEALEVPYAATPYGLVWHKATRDGTIPTPLTNFTATIVADTRVDDGAEQWRTFTLQATLAGETTRFDVPAAQFAGMGWVTEHLGAAALLYPGVTLKDHARAAIQLLSRQMVPRHVYAHLGWCEHQGQWLYLHAGGALGARGAVPGVDVQLDAKLARYTLLLPSTREALPQAIQASLRLLGLAPASLMVPLYGALWRAVLTEGDCSIHLAGPTGEGKTAVAALLQQHFGAQMDARHLPANWGDTANTLEALAFIAKDAVLVVDEFTPTDSVHAHTVFIS